jgi:hypothetical protein
MSSRPRAGKPLVLGVLREHPNQRRICRNVSDVDETPIKITIACFWRTAETMTTDFGFVCTRDGICGAATWCGTG